MILDNTNPPKIFKLKGGGTCSFHSVLHSYNGTPAVQTPTEKQWYKYGLLHRIEGPAVQSTTKEMWFEEGEYHREGGPAIMMTGREEWYRKGKLHRDDGYAFIDHPSKMYHYYLDGVKIEEKDWEEKRNEMKDH